MGLFSSFFGGPGPTTTTAAVVACAALVAYDSVCLVSQGDTALIERLGRFHRELAPGLHWKAPVLERVAAKWSIRERCLDVPSQKCISADNAPLEADAVVFYRVEDARRAKYAVDDYEIGLSHLVLTQLRTEIGRMNLDSTFSAREQLNAILSREANARTKAWGVVVTRVDVRDIQPSPEILKSMELQIAAERKKRAAVLESEGQRTSAVNAAKAERTTRLLAADAEQRRLVAEARGIATALDLVARALAGGGDDTDQSRGRAADLLLDRQLLAAHEALAQSPNTKVLSLASPSRTTIHRKRHQPLVPQPRRPPKRKGAIHRTPKKTAGGPPADAYTGIVDAAVAAAAAVQDT